MIYGNYRFICEFENEAELPPYKGSTFRGVFGHALKRVACALKRQECTDCILRERCLYVQVFEVTLLNDQSARNSSNPHPFVLEPPIETSTHFKRGDTFECGLVLFGEVNRMLPYFVFGFEQMGEIGVGRRLSGERGKFRIQTVTSAGKQIYSPTDGEVTELNSSIEIHPPILPDDHDSDLRVKIQIETPLRFKMEGRLSDGLAFDALTRIMLRRISSLFEAFDGCEPTLNYRELVQRSQSIGTEASDLKWFDWERYSNRQERGMNLGGLMGSVTYRGRLGEFMPLLEFCEKVHIGKQTSFGLGRIRVALL
jgi:hypothetical protein